MKPPRSALPLPRYVRRKPWGGRWFYFFDVPTWARKNGCSVKNEPLGTDHAQAVRRAEFVLLPAFDSWRTGGSDGRPDVGVITGSIDWMFDEFRKTWKEKTAKRPRPHSPGQCRVHETGIGMIADYVLKDGKRLGTRRVGSIDTAFVDDLFKKLLYKDVDGERVERRTTSNHAMKTARNAWNTVSRANPGVFPLKNPFEKMGLVAGDTRETPHATFEQLMTFRAKAIEMGYPSLATAAMMGWELLQRKAHIFIRFEVKHYRPADRPNHIYVINWKTGTGEWEPLFDANGDPLYPTLIKELDEIKAKRPTVGLMLRRDGTGRSWVGKDEQLTQVERKCREIIDSAGLLRVIGADGPQKLTFTSFGRHGGATEFDGVRFDRTGVDEERSMVVNQGHGELPPRQRRGQASHTVEADQQARCESMSFNRALRTDGEDLSEVFSRGLSEVGVVRRLSY